MVQHLCELRGSLKLKEGSAEAATAALRQCSADQGRTFAWPHLGVRLGPDGQSVEIKLPWRGRAGFRDEALEFLALELGELVVGFGHIELIDLEDTSGDPVQRCWVGHDEAAKALARATYGIELAREYVVEATGEMYFDKLVQGVLESVRAGMAAKRANGETR